MKDPKFLLLGTAIALSIPSPALAYSIGTVGVDIYHVNGNDWLNGGHYSDLSHRVSSADATGSQATAYGWTWGFANDDAYAWGSLFVNNGTSGINDQDLAYFCGHGAPEGIFLGSNYYYSNNTYNTFSSANYYTVPDNFYWSGYKLKWAVMDCCSQLYDGVTNGSSANFYSNPYPLSRWFRAFRNTSTNGPASGSPNGSLHAVYGHRSQGWDVTGVGSAFIDNALGSSGNSVGQAWSSAVYWHDMRDRLSRIMAC